MRNRLITMTALVLAVVGWWGLYELTNLVGPDQPGALYMFFALLFLAVTATLVPAALYLNQRLAPGATSRDPLRFFRHSSWGGVAVGISAWLQIHRAFNVGFALVLVLIFVAVEVLIVRLRAEA
ncbi:MAG: hypothetical protein M8467_11370 [Anaerolineae bacterium]|nr:hypothetical protein [Anaerolineae bacterium]